jgi:hypothetical protein
MRWFVTIVICSWVAAGCASRPASSRATASNQGSDGAPPKKTHSPAPFNPSKSLSPGSLSVTNKDTVITLTNPMSGMVVAVNLNLRFVVLDYSLKSMPGLEQRLGIYRQGQKVGEVKITGPEMGGNVVADILAGEIKTGDEARLE